MCNVYDDRRDSKLPENFTQTQSVKHGTNVFIQGLAKFLYTFSPPPPHASSCIPAPYSNANPIALTTLAPMTTHPVEFTLGFVIMLAVSHAKCLNPFSE